jgi:hypothetical protein
MDDETKTSPTRSNPLRALGLLGVVGLTVASCIVAGVLAGSYLEARLDAGGGVMALCILIGVFAGLASAATLLLGAIRWKP